MILVFGQSGMLGSRLCEYESCWGVGREQANFEASEDALRTQLARLLDTAPDLDGVINAAASTDVDGAESHEAVARRVNADAPGVLARLCAGRNLPLVHLSTDYVFGGEGSAPIAPDAPTAPLNAYGRTKRAGELAVLEAGGRAAVLRTSWVFDSRGRNFFTTMQKLALDTSVLRVVDDQHGRPTFAPDLADACLAVVRSLQAGAAPGVYHATNSGPVASWADFAEAIMIQSGLDTRVERVGSGAFPRPAVRPAWSVLDTTSLETTFGVSLPDWRDAVARAARMSRR